MDHNEFDHIEDSIRKSFEGFEIPVSDADWDRIASALPEPRKRKFGWFFGLFSGKLRISLLAIGILVITGITTMFVLNSGNNKITASNTLTEQTNAQKASGGANLTDAGSIDKTDKTADGNSGPEIPENTDAAVSRASVVESPPQDKSAHEAGKSDQNHPKTANTRTTEKPVNDKTAPENNLPETSNPKPWNPPAMPAAFGIRAGNISLPSILTASKLKTDIHPLNPQVPGKSQLYLALNTTFSPGKLSVTSGSNTWEGYQMLNGKNEAINVRLEGGVTLGAGNTRFTIGGALEGNPAALASKDSVRIKIADRFLPYYDQNGKLLYMLAVRWRDSVITLTRNPQRVWAEIPLGITRYMEKGDLRITAGITLNPGILLGSNDQVVNPYLFQSGSYWKYNNINADTSSLMISGKQFLNPFRLGTGLQLGIEKDVNQFSWGIEAQTRYYMTPVWKAGVPFKENLVQYGIRFRLGFKI